MDGRNLVRNHTKNENEMSHHKGNPHITCGEFSRRNFKVLAKDGTFLSYTSPLRIKILLKQGKISVVGEWTVQLNQDITEKKHYREFWKFKHELIGEMRIIPEYNVCYVCGADDHFTKHHVVPYSYTKHFPKTPEMQLRLYFLCAVLCPKCHTTYEWHIENNATEFRKQISEKYFPFSKEEFTRLWRISALGISYFRLLKKYDIVHAKELRQKIRDLLDGDDFEECFALSLSYHRHNSDYFKLIVQNVDNLNEFIELWKNHFIQVMQPKYLPADFDLGFKRI